MNERPPLKTQSEQWLPERSIAELGDALRRGEVTGERLTLMYIERILAHDRGGLASIPCSKSTPTRFASRKRKTRSEPKDEPSDRCTAFRFC